MERKPDLADHISEKDDLITLRRNREFNNIIDVELNHLDELGDFDSIECHIDVYPHSRRITSKHITFYPFEEYVRDISSHQRSEYTKIERSSGNIFGLLLGILIVFLVWLFNPEGLFAVESIVSIIGAYLIGKQVWDDIENLLIKATKKKSIRYQESFYRYQLERDTTLTMYSCFAKKHRYDKASLLPGKIDFVRKSNSQSMRMYFILDDQLTLKDTTAHIFSIHIDPSVMEDFEKHGFLFGAKLSFNTIHKGIMESYEMFHSLNKGEKGCLDDHGEWIENATFFRRTSRFYRLKYYKEKGVVKDRTIIKVLDS